jgi:histidine triad (HIT) family protein
MADNCLFCKIARGEIPAEVVYQDDRVVAFRDINPSAPTHVLVIPREHIGSASELDPAKTELAGYLLHVAAKVAQHENIAESGYRVVTNIGADGGQTVQHLHFHVIGGRKLSWPPG